jgi:hypothetical protein
MQGHTTIVVPLKPTHLCTTESARRGDFESLGAKLHTGLHSLLERTSKGNTPLELCGHVLSDQGSV